MVKKLTPRFGLCPLIAPLSTQIYRSKAPSILTYVSKLDFGKPCSFAKTGEIFAWNILSKALKLLISYLALHKSVKDPIGTLTN